MPAYFVFNEQVTDQARFDEYRKQAGPLIERYGGRFLIRGGAVTAAEGNPGLQRFGVIEFDDMAALRCFYDSAEYAPLIRLRQSASTGWVALVEGYTPT
jgi:uncharacterized protein (DUF1330 family)